MDLKLDNNLELEIKDGDLALEETPADTDAYLIIASNQGEWREFPLVGCNMGDFINSPETEMDEIKRRITMQINADGKKIKRLTTSSNNLSVELLNED